MNKVSSDLVEIQKEVNVMVTPGAQEKITEESKKIEDELEKLTSLLPRLRENQPDCAILKSEYPLHFAAYLLTVEACLKRVLELGETLDKNYSALDIDVEKSKTAEKKLKKTRLELDFAAKIFGTASELLPKLEAEASDTQSRIINKTSSLTDLRKQIQELKGKVETLVGVLRFQEKETHDWKKEPIKGYGSGHRRENEEFTVTFKMQCMKCGAEREEKNLGN